MTTKAAVFWDVTTCSPWNVGILLPDYMASHPRRHVTSCMKSILQNAFRTMCLYSGNQNSSNIHSDSSCFRAVLIKEVQILWDMTACRLVNNYWYFERRFCLQIQGSWSAGKSVLFLDSIKTADGNSKTLRTLPVTYYLTMASHPKRLESPSVPDVSWTDFSTDNCYTLMSFTAVKSVLKFQY